jgi:hypothetical protein
LGYPARRPTNVCAGPKFTASGFIEVEKLERIQP